MSLFFRSNIIGLLIALSVTAMAQQKKVTVITINGSINPASASYVHDALSHAQKERHLALILQLNTPGGLLQSTRNIVSDFLSASIPVIVFVSPRGGQAASAGAFITLSAHVAVMAPGTNIGAAHPVTMSEGENTDDSTNIMMTKATNDAAAFARTIAEKRGRNVTWAEESVRKSSSLTEREALDLNVIDFVADNIEDLIRKLDGYSVETVDGKVILYTDDIEVEYTEMTFKEKFLDTLSDPNIAYILMMLGIYGLFFELYNPGSIFPGVVGGICLILAFYSLNTLPVNYAGIALIFFGIVLFVLEIKVVSHGVLSIGGVVSLFLGSLMLFQTPTGVEFFEVSLSVILSVTLCTAAFFLFIVGKGIAIMKRKPTTGYEGLIGETGVVIDTCNPIGRVMVHGEYWKARATGKMIEQGTQVAVVAVKDMVVTVEPTDDSQTSITQL